jgi:biotin carboxylase
MGPHPGRRVILLGSARTYRTEAFTAAALRLGADVVTGDDVPLPMLSRTQSPLPLDYRDFVRATDAIVRFAEDHPVTAILGMDDSGTVLAARASAALGLPHNDPEAAQAARSKHDMRCRFAEAGVPSPAFALHHVGDDPVKLAASVSYPCVIKPTLLSGSRGVMRADTPAQFVERFARLARILAGERCDEVLVEEYIPGVEVALEGLLQEGRLRVLALFDKPDPLEGPFFEETLYVTPSRLPAEVQQAVADAAGHAAVALGLREGPVHAELRINDKGPWLVEVAARSIGGLCSKTLRFGTDMSLEELILRQALRMEIGSLTSATRAGGVLMIPIPRAGILRAVHGIEAAQAVPLVESVEITARTSYPLLPLPEGDSYLGFVFARGESPAEVEAALRAAHACLRFDIVAEMKVAAAGKR